MGSAPIAQEELGGFFAASLSQQLERLAAVGEVPNPPDVTVRFIINGQIVLQTHAMESFDPDWPDEELTVDLIPGSQLRIEVHDLDLAFHDLMGETTVIVPERPQDGRWILGPFGQVRRLVLRFE